VKKSNFDEMIKTFDQAKKLWGKFAIIKFKHLVYDHQAFWWL
jgi:hypothetical protein